MNKNVFISFSCVLSQNLDYIYQQSWKDLFGRKHKREITYKCVIMNTYWPSIGVCVLCSLLCYPTFYHLHLLRLVVPCIGGTSLSVKKLFVGIARIEPLGWHGMMHLVVPVLLWFMLYYEWWLFTVKYSSKLLQLVKEVLFVFNYLCTVSVWCFSLPMSFYNVYM